MGRLNENDTDQYTSRPLRLRSGGMRFGLVFDPDDNKRLVVGLIREP